MPVNIFISVSNATSHSNLKKAIAACFALMARWLVLSFKAQAISNVAGKCCGNTSISGFYREHRVQSGLNLEHLQTES